MVEYDLKEILPSDTTKIKHTMASLKRGRVYSDAGDAHTENSTIQNSPDAVNSTKLARGIG